MHEWQPSTKNENYGQCSKMGKKKSHKSENIASSAGTNKELQTTNTKEKLENKITQTSGNQLQMPTISTNKEQSESKGLVTEDKPQTTNHKPQPQPQPQTTAISPQRVNGHTQSAATCRSRCRCCWPPSNTSTNANHKRYSSPVSVLPSSSVLMLVAHRVSPLCPFLLCYGMAV